MIIARSDVTCVAHRLLRIRMQLHRGQVVKWVTVSGLRSSSCIRPLESRSRRLRTVFPTEWVRNESQAAKESNLSSPSPLDAASLIITYAGGSSDPEGERGHDQ